MRFRSPTEEPVRVALTDGHVILIGPEFREVPQRFVRHAIAEGALPEGVPAELMRPTVDPTDESSRADLITRALMAMKASAGSADGSPDEFTANGLPSVPAVSKRVGFKVSREETYEAWAAIVGTDDKDDDA